MANDAQNKNGEVWIYGAFALTILLPFFIAIGAVVVGVGAFFWLVAKLLVAPLKKPISRWFNVEAHSAHWSVMRVLYLPIMAAAFLFASYVACVGIDGYFVDKTMDLKHLLLNAVFYGPLVLASAIVFGLLWRVREAALDTEVQKRNAGAAAEKQVRRIIERTIRRKFDGRTLHGPLLVFRQGTDSEFSVELDHVLTTPKNVYLIETKYRSGTIYADENADSWQVSTHRGDSAMRNALVQVKNSINVIRRELDIPESVPIIPLVAFVGNNVEIRNGPSNVVAAVDLDGIITAFESTAKPGVQLDPDQIIAKFVAKRALDPDAFQKHIARIQRKKSKDEMRRIVQSASIN
jgi:nuclease-like protein